MSQFGRPEKRYIESAESRHNVARTASDPWLRPWGFVKWSGRRQTIVLKESGDSS